MRKFLIIFMIPFLMGTTYYVREDGGTSTQCTGQADAAYDGDGTGEACAYSHPFYATGYIYGLSQQLSQGDDLIIKDGPYNMGYDASWGDCSTSYTYDCRMRALPGGTSENHMTIYGENYADCDQDADKTELWGAGGITALLNLESSSADYIDFKCLKITDHDTCGENMPTEADPCGNSASFDSADTGLYGDGADNITLTDMIFWGLGTQGVLMDNGTNWTLTNVKFRYNALAGFNGDIDYANDAYGTMVFDNVEVTYSGCTDDYPNDAPSLCYSQTQGGYGDGIGFGGISSGDFTFRDCTFDHNVSDGLDILYNYGSGSILIQRCHAEGNAGNQIKVKGDAKIENSVLIGNCQYFEGKTYGLFEPEQSGRSGSSCDNDTVCDADENNEDCMWEDDDSDGVKDAGEGDCQPFDNCRAGGDTFNGDFDASDTQEIYNSTFYNGQSGYYLLTTDEAGTVGDCSGNTLTVKNSIFKGDANGSSYWGNYCSGLTLNDDYLVYEDASMDSANPTGTNIITTDPQFTSTVTHDLTLTSASPAINEADETVNVSDSDDVTGASRGASWDIGAYEYDGAAPECDADHCDLCLNEGDCTTATCYWYDEVCNDTEEVPNPVNEKTFYGTWYFND